MMRIAEPFLSSTENFEKIVVHGHTVTPSRRCEKARTASEYDTGAYATGRLTAVHLHPDGNTEFLETSTTLPGIVDLVAPLHV
ncbi:hypothetical protein ASE71_22615 [Ensifer sp. Root954]|nr:hypothetical protein ASD49_24935 [Ensifer sp. Root1298]KQX91844.1 hypothetical protein ASD41_23625 [Ensifer sp. Root1312]KRC26836.1 hypothetical protein ASE29_21305 [Ensifer sp. Root74]KRD71974.1 hypothetical protein ASE71_22615 [Ensifer sp. Root954]